MKSFTQTLGKTVGMALLATAFAFSAPAAANHHGEKADIVDTAVSAGSFKTLVAAMKAADLVDVLKSDGPYTVFAPTDDAFAKLPEDTIASLLKPENKARLQTVLTYHVIPGKVMSSDLAGKRLEAQTVQGQSVKVGATAGDVRVNDANVVKADIHTSNGVIHVIDTVILPRD